MPNNIVPQNGENIQNGPVWIDEAGEYAVYLNGEHIGWASTELAADSKYIEALITRRAHAMRCQTDITFMGEPAATEPTTEADTYGMEAIA